MTQYAHASWTLRNGQLPGDVRALAQTGDGSLWIGTESGLLSFDGLTFVPWRAPPGQPLLSNYISALVSARDGSLWIGTREGVSHWKGGRLENYRTSTGPLGPGAAAILERRDGTVWVAEAGYRSGGLCRVEAIGLHCYTAADGVPSLSVSSLFEDRSGNLWVGGLGALCRWMPGKPAIYRLPESLGSVRSIAEDEQDEIWASTASPDGLLRLTGGRLAQHSIPVSGPKIQPSALLSDRNGGFWIGTFGQGLLHLHQGQFDRFNHTDGLSNDVIRRLFEDREGNVWVATDGGLDRFRDFAVTTISEHDGLSQDTVGSVFASKNGEVWIGTRGGLNRILDGRISVFDKRNGLPSDSITAIFEEQSGRLWVDSSAGLAYLEQSHFTALDVPLGRQMRSINAAVEDRDHCVWFSDPEQGLVRFRDGNVAEVLPWSQFHDKQARALEAGLTARGLWLGFSQGGIAYYVPDRPTRWYAAADGLGAGAVTAFHLAPDGTLWIATEGGLSRLRGDHIATLTVANGLPCDRIHSMVNDDSGALWLNMACGLVHIAASDLSGWSANPRIKVPVRVFDATDGMRVRPIPGGYFRRAAKSSDGRLWFAVLDGVAVVDPKHLPENRLPPPVRIDQIIADRAVYTPNSNLMLPPLTKELQIDYTAFSFVAPEKVQFRYRLEGFDKEWHDAGVRRQALYTNLPPKRYQFRVIACNNDGVWNESGTSLGFSIMPALYQANWFRLVCLAAFTLLLWGLYRLRLRQIAVQLAVRFQERLAERTRIAGELHDTLLQNIAGFALQLEGLAKTVSAPSSAKERLHDLREQAEQWLHEARESVWDLRSPTFEGHDLRAALQEAGEQITTGKPVQFQVIVLGKRHPASAILKAQLLRIVQEATRNAVHHGQAKQISVQVAYLDKDLIRVQIRDDGCGFVLEEASRKSGHWGLATMRERAQQIGAELNIWTSPGHGSTIEIVAPITSPPR